MQHTVDKVAFPVFVDQVRSVLTDVGERGINWQRTRFGSYLGELVEEAQRSHPRVLRIRDATAPEDLLWEAAGQCQQLVNSSATWAKLDAAILVSKLEKVFRGSALPPVVDDDEPRNTLLELNAATLFARAGFDVDITASEADLVVGVPELAPFAVECKRPVRRATVKKNVKKLRSQLGRRYRDGYKHGIAVLGVDRIEQMSGELNAARDLVDVRRVLDAKTRRLRDEVREHVRDPFAHLYPETPLFAFVHVGPVFVGDEGIIYNIGLLSFFCTGPEDSATSVELVRAFERRMTNRPL